MSAVSSKIPARIEATQFRTNTSELTNRFRLPESKGAWNLRWRSPERVNTASHQEPQKLNTAGPMVMRVSGDWLDQPPNQQQQSVIKRKRSVDPFNDPFGDKTEQRVSQNQPAFTLPDSALDDHPSLAPNGLQPAPEILPPSAPNTQPPANPLFDPPANQGFQPPTNPGFQPPVDPEMQLDPAPPLPTDPAPYPSDPNAFDPLSPSNDSARCNRVYNDRNCCDEEDLCERARQYVRDNVISNISLDITPRFKPDVEDAAEAESAMQDKISEAPSRNWFNRVGEMVADGYMKNYKNGRVWIEQADGEIVKVSVEKLSDDDMCFLSAYWGLPTECSVSENEYIARNFLPSTFTWKASALCHKPLYFEEVQLERYGHTLGPFSQPIFSGAHFFLNIAVLPYRMGINPPKECQYALGYYRPGNCAPWLLHPIPLSARGALFQTGAVLAPVFALP